MQGSARRGKEIPRARRGNVDRVRQGKYVHDKARRGKGVQSM